MTESAARGRRPASRQPWCPAPLRRYSAACWRASLPAAPAARTWPGQRQKAYPPQSTYLPGHAAGPAKSRPGRRIPQPARSGRAVAGSGRRRRVPRRPPPGHAGRRPASCHHAPPLPAGAPGWAGMAGRAALPRGQARGGPGHPGQAPRTGPAAARRARQPAVRQTALPGRPSRPSPMPRQAGQGDARPGQGDARPGPEEARPGPEEARPGPEEARPGPEEARPGPEEARPGPEAPQAGTGRLGADRRHARAARTAQARAPETGPGAGPPAWPPWPGRDPRVRAARLGAAGMARADPARLAPMGHRAIRPAARQPPRGRRRALPWVAGPPSSPPLPALPPLPPRPSPLAQHLSAPVSGCAIRPLHRGAGRSAPLVAGPLTAR
jgi:hypothetical protein